MPDPVSATTHRQVDWRTLVEEYEDLHEEEEEYSFSNGRKFKRRPGTSGLYEDD